MLFPPSAKCSVILILVFPQQYFNSAEGDHLNLKSTFCKYLFASVCGDKEFLTQGEIVCSKDADYQRLRSFLTEQ